MTLNRKIFPAALAACLFIPAYSFGQIIVLSPLSYVDTANPGQTYTAVIKIKNDGKKDERVSLSQNDYLFYSDGSNKFGEPGMDPRSNASWIKLTETEVTIPPGTEYEIPYLVSVPPRADLTGTYWSLVMVQAITESILNPGNEAEGSVGVNAGMRYGIQVATNMGDTGKRSLRFFDTKLDKGDQFSTLRISLENTGERKLVAAPYADLFSSAGKPLGRIQATSWGIYPGTSVRIAFPLQGMEKGRYKAQVVADCGGNDLFGAIYSLEIK